MKKQITNLKVKISCDSPATIVTLILSQTDYQYNQRGTQIAVSDSEGTVYIYDKVGQNYNKSAQFSADEGSIWKILWGPFKYGKLLAIGSFKSKVAIFQQRNQQWVQIANHQLHEASVNCIAWAHQSYGIKLFAGGSDGKVSLLQLKWNVWTYSIFTAHSLAINYIVVQPLPLNEEQINDDGYPRIVTASKDQSIKIWTYAKEQQQNCIGNLFSQALFTSTATYTPHKQMIRSVIWRPTYGGSDDNTYELVTCSQDGSVKVITFNKKGFQSQFVLLQQEHPISRISQSITGKIIGISVAASTGENAQITYLFHEKDLKNWECIKKLEQI